MALHRKKLDLCPSVRVNSLPGVRNKFSKCKNGKKWRFCGMYYFNIPALISMKFSENIIHRELFGQKNSFDYLEQFSLRNHVNLTRELYFHLSVTHSEKFRDTGPIIFHEECFLKISLTSITLCWSSTYYRNGHFYNLHNYFLRPGGPFT